MTELEACKELLEFYEQNEGERWRGRISPHCPLCEVFSCIDCLWVKFTGFRCGGYAMKFYKTCVMELKLNQSHKSEKWRIDRIAMLKEWIKELESV